MTTMMETCPHLTKKGEFQRWGHWKARTKNPWLLRLWRRVYKRNQNFLAIVYGETGSGKTYTCLKLGRMLDPTFSVDNVVFEIRDFFDLLNSGKLHSGSVVVFEELGVAANSRKWYSDQNQWMSFVNQVFRNRNLIVLYTVPKLDMVDSQLAKLAHGHIEALGIEYAKRKNRFKVFDPVQWDDKSRKWYRHLVAFGRGNKTYKASIWRVGKIPAAMAHAYENKRTTYEQKLTKSAQEAMVESEEKTTQKKQLTRERIDEVVNEVIRDRFDYMDEGRFHTQRVMEHFNMGLPNARVIKQAVKDKMLKLGFIIGWR